VKEQLVTPTEIRHQIWKELGRATHDRHHAWRTPVFCTVNAEGLVNARTVVLRQVDVDAEKLQIYTDARSCKADELQLQPNAMFVFWSQRLRWQLRIRVMTSVFTEGPELERLWERVKQSASAGDYLTSAAPGIPLAPNENAINQHEEPTPHFALINASILEIDWLELSSSGHRRARVTAKDWEWLTP
jgi:hypothetical protein